MDKVDRLSLTADKYVELSYRNDEFFLRLIERQTNQPPVYLTHEFPISRGELESLAYTPRHANVLMNLSGLHVRYMDQQLAFMEDGTVLAWGARKFMEHFVQNWFKQLGQTGTAKSA